MRVTVNGTEIYFDVHGAQLRIEGDMHIQRPALVVLHGGPGFDHLYLRSGLDPLAEQAQLVYVDLRGQGRSGHPPVDSCTLEQMADDVAALCRLAGIERPVVFGHSAGGFVALHLTVRHPTLAGALVLCNTAPTLKPLPDGDPPPLLADRAGPDAVAAAGRLFGGDMSTSAQEAFGRLVVPYYAGAKHMDIPRALLAHSTFNTEVAAHFFGVLAPLYDLRSNLPGIAIPTLVIVGSEDWVCPPGAGRTIARAIPGAELAELAGVGHFSFAEDPGSFRSAVTRFMTRVAAPLKTPFLPAGAAALGEVTDG